MGGWSKRSRYSASARSPGDLSSGGRLSASLSAPATLTPSSPQEDSSFSIAHLTT